MNRLDRIIIQYEAPHAARLNRGLNLLLTLCWSSRLHQNEARRSRLFCRYHDGRRNPRLLLKPMKEEDEWDSPHIVRYLEMLSHEETERIKELAKPKVRRIMTNKNKAACRLDK